MHQTNTDLITSLIREIPDFPKPGILFKDITPLLANPQGFSAAITELVRTTVEERIDVVIGTEARGFIFAAPVALALGIGFVPVRKPGKLPSDVLSVSYDLEYGQETLEMHTDALRPGARVLIVDDVLATGGTLVAAADLVRQAGAEVVGISVLLELAALDGAKVLAEADLPEAKVIVRV